MAVNIRCKVEICRYGCPDHCQRPNSYTAREQEVSASVAVPQYTKPQQQPRHQLQYKPGPRFEAHRTPGAGGQLRRQDTRDNEIPQAPPQLQETVRSVADNKKRAPAAQQKAGGLFDGIFSLPQFKLPWAGAGAGRRRDQARPAESEVSVVNLGVTP